MQRGYKGFTSLLVWWRKNQKPPKMFFGEKDLAGAMKARRSIASFLFQLLKQKTLNRVLKVSGP